MKISIRPYNKDSCENLLLFSDDDPNWNKMTGCIGHLRGDFGISGNEFYCTFEECCPELNTPAFRTSVDSLMNMLRSSNMVLSSRNSMKSFCHEHEAIMPIGSDFAAYYGYRINTFDGYTYMLRTFLDWGNYNFYIYCYQTDKLNKFLNNSFHLFVGKKDPEWCGLPEGMVINWDECSGFNLFVFLKDINENELDCMSSDSHFDIRFIPLNNVGFFCVKFGMLIWSNCFFSPHIYEEKPVFPALDKPNIGYALNVFLVDTGNGELKHIRQIGLGHEFSSLFRSWAVENLKKDISTEDIESAVERTYSRYTTAELAEKAIIRYVE